MEEKESAAPTGLSVGDGDTTRGPPADVRTFLIADVRGYTRFTQEHGDEQAGELAARFADLAGEVVSSCGGQVLELRGDEALAVFGSARQAPRAAVVEELRDVQVSEGILGSFRFDTNGDKTPGAISVYRITGENPPDGANLPPELQGTVFNRTIAIPPDLLP
jgi:hypothetical protein